MINDEITVKKKQVLQRHNKSGEKRSNSSSVNILFEIFILAYDVMSGEDSFFLFKSSQLLQKKKDLSRVKHLIPTTRPNVKYDVKHVLSVATTELAPSKVEYYYDTQISRFSNSNYYWMERQNLMHFIFKLCSGEVQYWFQC